jgi:adenylate cyclase
MGSDPRMKWPRRIVTFLGHALPLIATLGWCTLDPGGIIASQRRTVFDYFQRIRPREYEAAPVKIVDIDDASLTKIGQWPWPRTSVAALVDRLARAGAAVIALDIVFAESDRTSPTRLVPVWSAAGYIDDATRQALAALPDHDEILAASIKAAGNVVAGFVLTRDKQNAAPLKKGTFATAGDDPRPYIPAFEGAVDTLPILTGSAAGNGSVSFVPDGDFIIRRVPLVQRLGQDLYPMLGAEALRVAQGARSFIVKSTGASREYGAGTQHGIVSVKIGKFVVPTDADGMMLIHYTRTVPDRTIPAWRVMAPDFDPDSVRGDIVLIGTSAAGLFDIRPSPINPVMPGVEAHAQAIEQILLGHYLQRPDWAASAELLFVLVVGIALIVLLRLLGAVWSGVVGTVAIAGAFAASWHAYSHDLLLVDPVTPSLAAFVVYLSATVSGYLRSESEKRQVRGAFSQYLSPALVQELTKDPSRLRLGGDLREMTFLFCDVRGFTSISERFKSNPQGLTQLINRFLTPMTDVILARRGTIDKYMGDCIMAFWNAPLDDPDHAAHACASALAMLRELEAVNNALKSEAEAERRPFYRLQVGIGLNTGECVVGNMGSQQRFDYSVLGDAVNLASRLEGQSKTYGVATVIGEDTRAKVPAWAAIELDLIAVKGKKEAVRVYALLGDPELAQTASFRAMAVRHEAMLASYRAKDWPSAAALVDECRALEPRLTALYDLYAERIAYFEAKPPLAEWDGVFVAETK